MVKEFTKTVGIIANPMSGRDGRRLAARASSVPGHAVRGAVPVPDTDGDRCGHAVSSRHTVAAMAPRPVARQPARAP